MNFFTIKSKLLISLSFYLLTFLPVSAQETENEDYLNVGGALRFNVASHHFETDNNPTDNYATIDTWRVNFKGSYSNVVIDFEYRFYPTFNTHFIHHGFLGYDFSDQLNMQLGVTQVPFGNLTYNSHSWWFLTPYYLGLEDDYDMGVKFTLNPTEKLNLMVGYFRQQEPAGPAYGSASFGGPGAGTYSYNVIPGLGGSIREMNQFNLRAAYEIFEGTELGFSGQVQGLYNSTLDETDYGHAVAGHVNANFSNFDFILQYTNYDYKAQNDDGEIMDRVQVGAYGDPYYGDGVAARGNILTAGLAYTIPLDFGPISSVQPYVDYSFMSKDGQIEAADGNMYDFEPTHMLVPGFLISAGAIYTYVDFAMGKNHPWLTDAFGTGMGAGHLYTSSEDDGFFVDDNKVGQPVSVEDMDWNLRFNINIGYYF